MTRERSDSKAWRKETGQTATDDDDDDLAALAGSGAVYVTPASPLLKLVGNIM